MQKIIHLISYDANGEIRDIREIPDQRTKAGKFTAQFHFHLADMSADCEGYMAVEFLERDNNGNIIHLPKHQR